MFSVGTNVYPGGKETPVPFANVFQPKNTPGDLESAPVLPAIVISLVPVDEAGTDPEVPLFELYVTVYVGRATAVSTTPSVRTGVPITTVKPHLPPAPITPFAFERQPNSVVIELVAS
ncbi:unannotated protein [freshwater metagenome]|uniref:Unannotated protein n=1 Tax=freshwater metagenome TaxID=449393 RepID=A0A6J6LH22_9ZZZZ